MATAQSGRSRQHRIRIVAVPRKKVDLVKLARVVLELAKQLVAEEQQRKKLQTKRPSRIRHATSLHRRGRASKTRGVAKTRARAHPRASNP